MYPIISHLLELRGILGGGVGEFLSLLSGVPGEEMRLSAATAASAADVPGGGMPALSRERRKSGDLKIQRGMDILMCYPWLLNSNIFGNPETILSDVSDIF